MMSKVKRSIWLNLMLCMPSCKGFIYDVRIMRKWDSASNRFSYFIGLGDFHDKSHDMTALQIKQIDQILAKLQPNKIKVIVEDVSSKGAIGKKCCGRFFVRSSGGILGGLVKRLKDKRCPYVENIEYRFCRVASLAPVIKNIKTNFRKILSAAKIYTSCLSKEVAYTANDILRYKDGNVLNSWYKTCLLETRKNMKSLKFDKKLNMSVADFIYSMTTPKTRLNFVKKLLIFDSSLIDAKIAHAIVHAPRKQYALVIAGGSHVKNVSNVLQKVGYKSMYQSKVVVQKGKAKKNCPWRNILPGGFCYQPRPADLRVLNKFI